MSAKEKINNENKQTKSFKFKFTATISALLFSLLIQDINSEKKYTDTLKKNEHKIIANIDNIIYWNFFNKYLLASWIDINNNKEKIEANKLIIQKLDYIIKMRYWLTKKYWVKNTDYFFSFFSILWNSNLGKEENLYIFADILGNNYSQNKSKYSQYHWSFLSTHLNFDQLKEVFKSKNEPIKSIWEYLMTNGEIYSIWEIDINKTKYIIAYNIKDTSKKYTAKDWEIVSLDFLKNVNIKLLAWGITNFFCKENNWAKLFYKEIFEVISNYLISIPSEEMFFDKNIEEEKIFKLLYKIIIPKNKDFF